MKIAVCVSGIPKVKNPKSSLIRINEIQHIKFPTADFFYATWDGYKEEFEKLFPSEQCTYFPEPTMHYHPYLDIDPKDHVSKFYQQTIHWVKKSGREKIDWSSHHTKQILIHMRLIHNVIPNAYDIIVRTRYDALISKNADFTPYLEDTFINHRPNGFAATKKPSFDTINEFKRDKESMHDSWLADQLIIHNRGPLDAYDADYLHEHKQLHAAEYGWYQILSKPYGSNHRSHDGWVNHERNVEGRFFW